jgi:excisionase family DNA binding protein
LPGRVIAAGYGITDQAEFVHVPPHVVWHLPPTEAAGQLFPTLATLYFVVQYIHCVHAPSCCAVNSLLRASAASNGERRRFMEAPAVTKEWLSYSEAQRYAGIGRTKLGQLIKSGEVKAARVGRAVRINRRSLDEYMDCSPYVETDSVARGDDE